MTRKRNASTAEIAARFRVTPHTVRGWVKRRTVPFRRGKGGRLYFDPDEVEAALGARAFDGRPGRRPRQVSEEERAANLRFRLARAERAEIGTARLRGEFLPREEVEHLFGATALTVRTTLENHARAEPLESREWAEAFATSCLERIRDDLTRLGDRYLETSYDPTEGPRV